MKSIRNILILMLIGCTWGVFLQSCSDDLDVRNGIYDVPEGTIRLNIAVPDPVTVSTRGEADESSVKTLDLYVFPQNGGTPAYIHYADVSGNSVGVTLPNENRNELLRIYALANVAGMSDNIQNESELKNQILKAVVNVSNGLPMIGYVDVNPLTDNSATVALYRNAVKISVATSVANTELTGFDVRKYATQALAGAPLNANDNSGEEGIFITGNGVQSSTALNCDGDKLAFIYPSKGISENGKSDGAFLVAGVKRNGTEQYYRINLRDKNEDGVVNPIDLYPNHYYKVEITGFFRDGYETADEASQHPESDQYITYTIHDHALKVLSMVTDGYYELGVSPNVVITRTTNDEGQVIRTGTLIVKCYSPDGNETETQITFPNKESLKNWLQIGDPNNHTIDDPNPDYDGDSRGVQFEVPISIGESTKIYDDQTWDLTVEWKGLKRTVKVSYEAAFVLPEVSHVTLTIKEDGTNDYATIYDYWTFIHGEGVNKDKEGVLRIDGDKNTPQLYGIKADKLNGNKKRTNGFHFPMPYGVNHKTFPWTYEYDVDFTMNGLKTVNELKYEITGDAFITSYVSWTEGSKKGTGKLTLTGGQSEYTYAGGKIAFKVTYSDNETTDVEASIYHTGFFHYEGNTDYVPSDGRGYYYYEVVPMGKDAQGNDLYWLDRNIGAKANTSFIDYEMAEQNRESAGMFYTIAQPRTFNDTDFEQGPAFDTGMCPPGYHIPNQTEWDALRMDKNFKTRSVVHDRTTYMETYYDSPYDKIGNIYLQKARFHNEPSVSGKSNKYTVPDDYTVNAGDAGAGYYWTITTAPAMEKEQIAAWLRALYLNGSASSYVNASITDHRMPVRCIAGNMSEAKTATEYYVSINVHEVTHVFLFDISTQTPLYTFPGKAVGSTNSSIKWQNFYCTTTIEPSKLGVLFVKLESDGRVTIYKKNGESFEAKNSYSKEYLTGDNFWNVTNGNYYDFCEAGVTREPSNVFGKDYLAEKFPGKDYPTDCKTSEDSGSGGGGGGGGLTGDQTWEGNFGMNWDLAFKEWAYGGYDWSTVNGGTLKVYYTPNGDYQIQFKTATGNNGQWGNLDGVNNDDYKIWSNPTNPIEIQLNQRILNDLQIHDGLIITGANFILTKIELKVD